MNFKKIAVIGSTLIVSALPVFANALNLITYNHTSKDSTVRITSNKGRPCSDSFGKITRAGSSLVTTQADIRGICFGSSPVPFCIANMYAAADCDKTGGTFVGTLRINLNTLAVEKISPITAPYKVDIANNAQGSTVTIS